MTASPIPPGTRLGSYEFVAPIGAGGMGEVYRARDTTLGRDVAIKILPKAFASDQDRVERFEREARTLATLRHPHIAQIYGLERANDIQALVLELVDGETLADRIGRGPLPVPEAVEIAKQIASALQAAHLKGIVHRDLKPANVMVEQEINVKVLDFGLARSAESPVSSTSTSPTMASPAMTGAGMILGTAAYMSPEQAKGRTADRRSDVWAFGCVLYEMLTGTRAFGGEGVTEVITAVVRDEPEWKLLPAALPPAAAVFLRRCLEKDPNRRVQDIGDVRLALEGAFDVPERPSVGVGASGVRRSAVWIATVALLVAAAAAAAGWMLKPAAASPAVGIRRVTIPTLPGVLHIANTNRDIAIARDGSLIVYFAGQGQARQIVVRRLDSLAPTTLRTADRLFEPTISSDSQWVAFNDESDFTLRKVRLSGGATIPIAKVNEEILGATWEGDTIIYATAAGLWQVSAAGGTPSPLTRPDMTATGVVHAWPAFVPGRDAVLYAIQDYRTGSSSIAVLDLRSGKSRVLLDGGTNPRLSLSGHLLYGAEGTIHAVAFDAASLSVTGGPVPVVPGVLSKRGGGVDFDVASDGTLVYVPGTGIVQRQLTWVEPNGTRHPVGAEPRSYGAARISPDGGRVALEIRDQDSDIWIWDFSRSTLTRLTTDPAFDGYPVWSPDGRRLLFGSRRRGQAEVFSQLADGTGDPQQLTDSGNPTLPNSITPDGATLIVEGSSSSLDLLAIPLQPPGPLRPLLANRFNEVNAEVSPDGRWMAYESDEPGRIEIFVRPWPDVDSGRWQVSAGGGRHAAWSAGGRELFYIDGTGRLARVPVRVHNSTEFEAGPGSIVVATPFYAGLNRRSYDVSADGRRILLIENTPDTNVSAASIIAVFNWTEELKRARRE